MMKRISDLFRQYGLKAFIKAPVLLLLPIGLTAAIVLIVLSMTGFGKTGDDISSNAIGVGNNTVINNETVLDNEKENDLEEIVVETKTFTVTFYDSDKTTVLQRYTGLKSGTTPKYTGEIPSKKETIAYKYEFNGWDKEITKVDDDTNYYAKYKIIEKPSYRVTYFDSDGCSVLKTEYKYEGQLPTYDGSDLGEDERSRKIEFVGWDRTFSAVTKDTEYTAKYKITNKKAYTITFANEDGSVLYKDIFLKAKSLFIEEQIL